MKRRVVRIGDRRFKVEIPGGDVSEFSYHEKPRRWDPDQETCVDFGPEEDRFVLRWDGVMVDTFWREEEVLLFILKFGYSIGDKQLVPSEILADFQLVYEGNAWVDEWSCEDQKQVLSTLSSIIRPADRRIRFEGYPRITPKQRPIGFVRPWEDNDWDYSTSEVVAEIEIPELNFEELEKPRKRRRTIPRNWRDPSDPSLEHWNAYKASRQSNRDRYSDAECVFTLEIGEKAAESHEKRQQAQIVPEKDLQK
jgi:hypothetical protein